MFLLTNLFKMNKYITCFNFTIRNIFTKTPKSEKCLKLLDKISIFEYFDVFEERKKARLEESLVKEITEYINSNTFESEFKNSFAND